MTKATTCPKCGLMPIYSHTEDLKEHRIGCCGFEGTGNSKENAVRDWDRNVSLMGLISRYCRIRIEDGEGNFIITSMQVDIATTFIEGKE